MTSSIGDVWDFERKANCQLGYVDVGILEASMVELVVRGIIIVASKAMALCSWLVLVHEDSEMDNHQSTWWRRCRG